MYCKYVLTTGTVTLSQVQDDIIGLLTGTITAPAGLSASANTAACEVVTTVAGGWTLFDSSAGAAANGVTPKVLRAAYSDDGTKYKYLMIKSTAAGELGFEGWETWDAGADTGTNRTHTVTAAQWGTVPFAVSQQCIISSSATEFFLWFSTSATSGAYVHLCEFERDDPWNTIGNGYPSWLFLAGRYNGTALVTYQNAVIPRAPYGTSNVDLAPTPMTNAANNPRMIIVPTSAGLSSPLGFSIYSGSYNTSGYLAIDANKVNAAAIRKFRLSSYGTMANGRSMQGGLLKSALRAQGYGGVTFDTLTVGADVYVVVGDITTQGSNLYSCIKRE